MRKNFFLKKRKELEKILKIEKNIHFARKRHGPFFPKLMKK